MRQLGFWALFIWAGCSGEAWSQTPSPLQEWQYTGGVILERLFRPDLPEWSRIVGVATSVQPLYDGASQYHALLGPVVNIRYQDIAFASVGEGLGWNFIRADHYRLGLALGYDLGRKVSDDAEHLRGMGDIKAAPVIKLFGSYVISKEFPLVLRADIRQIIGGAHGLMADLGAYIPLPGSSEKLVMFAGPSVTYSDQKHLETTFGVNQSQSTTSGYPVYTAHAGLSAFGAGFSATRFLTKHWLINGEAAIHRLVGSASESPIAQAATQSTVSVSAAYRW